MQRTQIEDEIGRLLGDQQHRTWSTTILRDRVTTATNQIQALTGAVTGSASYTPTAEDPYVTIGYDVIDIIRVTITDSQGDKFPLEGVTESDMDFYYPDWENWNSGKPSKFIYDAKNNRLRLIPKPSSDYAISNAIGVKFIEGLDALSDDSSEAFGSVDTMQIYSMAIVHWVVAQCFMDIGTPEALAKSKFHRSNLMDQPGEFEKWIKLINANFQSPSSVLTRIQWKKQGGRLGGGASLSKSYPFS